MDFLCHMVMTAMGEIKQAYLKYANKYIYIIKELQDYQVGRKLHITSNPSTILGACSFLKKLTVQAFIWLEGQQ